MSEPTSQSGNRQSARALLAMLRETKPQSKAAQIRALWSDIKAALDKGHSLKTVCDCLEADGITVTVQTLGSYITRMRRKATPSRLPQSAIRKESEGRNIGGDSSGVVPPADRLANIRRELERKRTSGFHYSPFPDKEISEAINRDTNFSQQEAAFVDRSSVEDTPDTPMAHERIKAAEAPDPLANIRRGVEKKRNSGFNYSPFPDQKDQ